MSPGRSDIGRVCFRLVCALLVLSGSAPVTAQPRIAELEIFGVRKTPLERIRRVLNVKPGDPLPRSKGDLEEKLGAIAGVVQARLEAWCCEDGKAVLYVGILEKGAVGFEYRPEPAGDAVLPEEVVAAYRGFTSALNRAVAEGDTEEDLTRGHSLMKNINCRVAQERFVGLAQLYPQLLRLVLRESPEPEHRAIAAYVIGYAESKRAVVEDLQAALRDPDEGVRANAARALKAIAVLAASDPELGIRVETTWFVEMLNSVVLSDRLEGLRALLQFTEKPAESTLKHIRERALPSLFEMARWKHLQHALPAYLLLGRVAVAPEAEMQQAWVRGEREKMLENLRKKLR